MLPFIKTDRGIVKKGDVIRIDHMDDNAPSFTFSKGKDKSAPAYDGKTGTVDYIDDSGQIHGTWGGLALIPGVDRFTIVSHS